MNHLFYCFSFLRSFDIFGLVLNSWFETMRIFHLPKIFHKFLIFIFNLIYFPFMRTAFSRPKKFLFFLQIGIRIPIKQTFRIHSMANTSNAFISICWWWCWLQPFGFSSIEFCIFQSNWCIFLFPFFSAKDIYNLIRYVLKLFYGGRNTINKRKKEWKKTDFMRLSTHLWNVYDAFVFENSHFHVRNFSQTEKKNQVFELTFHAPTHHTTFTEPVCVHVKTTLYKNCRKTI